MSDDKNICVSIGNLPVDKINTILKNVGMAEIRIDLAGLHIEQIEQVFSSHNNLIATCRQGELEDEARFDILERAVRYGAAWVDLDAATDSNFLEQMTRVVRSADCKLILSRHFYSHTPSCFEMREIIETMFVMKADIVKIAAQVNHPADAASILGLYGIFKSNLVAVGMGPHGVITRIAAPLLGAPFTFASYGDSPVTAIGQVDYFELKEMMSKIVSYG